MIGEKQTALLLHIPVIHQGYLDLIERYRSENPILLLPGPELIEEYTHLHREIRALQPWQVAKFLLLGGFISPVCTITKADLSDLTGHRVITTNERLTRSLIELIPQPVAVTHDSAFLRWDEENIFTQTTVSFDRQLAETDNDYVFVAEMMRQAQKQAGNSGDWWRHVGAVLAPNQHSPFTGYNRHVPDQLVPYVLGDPRDSIPAGEQSEISTAFHAEASLIAQAARQGVPTLGARLFLTTFPCPACAKLIAFTGIRQLFFATGHASLDGESILRGQGVELIYAPN